MYKVIRVQFNNEAEGTFKKWTYNLSSGSKRETSIYITKVLTR